MADEYGVELMCDLMQLERSTYYYQPTQADDSMMRAAIQDVAARFPRYGYVRVYAQLKRERCEAVRSEWQVRLLMAAMGLKVLKKPRKRHTTKSDHAFPRYANLVLGATIASPDEVWVSDIKYIHTRREDVYLAILMDVFTRGIRGWELSRDLDASLTLSALQDALRHSRPGIHHSDQGVQYACNDYTAALQGAGVKISMADVGQAWQNGYAERFMGILEDEEVSLSDYMDFHDAYNQIGRFIDEVYMHQRIHSSLGWLTPIEFEQQWQAQQQQQRLSPP
jgi:transposase InsO family protein